MTDTRLTITGTHFRRSRTLITSSGTHMSRSRTRITTSPDASNPRIFFTPLHFFQYHCTLHSFNQTINQSFTMAVNIGEQIALVLTERGITRTDLGQRIGLTGSGASYITKKETIDVETLARI